MSAVFADMNDPTTHLHVVTEGGEFACALLAREQNRDCYFWFVATAPEARGRGLASELYATHSAGPRPRLPDDRARINRDGRDYVRANRLPRTRPLSRLAAPR